MLNSCHGCLDRLTHWIFAFDLDANLNFRVRMISAYLANALASRIKIKIEPSFTHCIRAALAGLKCLLSRACAAMHTDCRIVTARDYGHEVISKIRIGYAADHF